MPARCVAVRLVKYSGYGGTIRAKFRSFCLPFVLHLQSYFDIFEKRKEKIVFLPFFSYGLPKDTECFYKEICVDLIKKSHRLCASKARRARDHKHSLSAV